MIFIWEINKEKENKQINKIERRIVEENKL
jgi:hypothetical protein